MAGLALITEAAVAGALRPPYAVATGATIALAIGVAALVAGFATTDRFALREGASGSAPFVREPDPEPTVLPEPKVLVIGSMPIFLDARRAGESARRRVGWIAVGVTLLAVFLAILWF